MRGGAASSLVKVGQFSHEFARLANAGLRLASTGLRAPPQPLDFPVNQIFQRFLTLGLRMQKFFFLLEKCAVVAAHSKRAIGIDAVEFDHIGRDIFQKITVVTYDDASE